MFVIAFLLGIYAYLLFFLGLNGWLYTHVVLLVSSVFLISIVIWRWNTIWLAKKKEKLLVVFTLLIVLQGGVNLIGALGPELAFDALWYHLPIPKIWLITHTIAFIPGGLLYYSVMPQLGELLFIPGLVLGGAIGAKLIHFSFGLLICVALYQFQRKFFTPFVSIIGVVIFYTNLVVGWESTTAYIDLIRTFFELLGLWALINWWENKEKRWFCISAVMIGLAIATKLLAIGSLVIMSILIAWYYRKSLRNILFNTTLYWVIALLVPAPWFIFAYLTTGNPVFPLFTEYYQVVPEPLSIVGFFIDIWNLLLRSSDPLSPLYIIFLPLVIFCWPKWKKEVRIIGVYSVLAFVVWYFTPRSGGGRFILPYLPAFSMLCAACIYYFEVNKKKFGVRFYQGLLLLIFLITLTSLGYRFVANAKYLPVILGQQTQQEFLSEHLNFSFGDFYDTDNYFKDHITQDDTVLLYGFHNLYYVDFPFIDASWVKDDDKFTYIATQRTKLPEKYKDWKLVYTNGKTMVNLYKKVK